MAELSELTARHFPLFWALPLGVCLALGLRFPAAGPSPPTPAAPRSALDFAALALLLGFAASSAFLMLYKEDFLAGDNDFFTTITLRGERFGWPIWPDVGRYWPLGNQEFNLIRNLTVSAAGYHAIPALQFLIALGCAAVLLRGYALPLALLLAAVAMTFEGVTISFYGLIYPERNLLFLLALFFVAYERLAGRYQFVWLALGLTAAQLALYYKEPVFVLVGGFAIAQLLWQRRAAPSSSLAELAKSRWVDVSLVVLSLYFLGMFAISWLPLGSTSYSGERSVGALRAALVYLQREPLLVAMLAGFALRWVLLALGRARYQGPWDSAAIAAALYFLLFVTLGLWGQHYTVPTTFVLWLAGARLLAEPLASRRAGRAAVAGAAAAVLLFVNLPTSARHVLERKAKIDSQSQLVAALRENLGQRPGHLDLLFPASSGYWIMTLGAYLDFRGLAVDQVGDDGRLSRQRVSLHSPFPFAESRCVPWSSIACSSLSGPARIDYIVVLPDDPLPDVEVEKLAADATRVFQYERATGPWERALRILGGDADAGVRARLYRMNPESGR